MGELSHLEISNLILQKAKVLGASLAGLTRVEDVKKAPAFTLTPRIAAWKGIGSHVSPADLAYEEVNWPVAAETVLVIALTHPMDKPELDWWSEQKNPPGNRVLISIIKQLCEWVTQEFGFETFHFPYHVEKGGIYLKDAAVLAGLGCIGKNNLLITPAYGPYVRLRAMAIDVALPPSDPIDFDPCTRCEVPCRRSCPQGAFGEMIYDAISYNQQQLPGRKGDYARSVCNVQMLHDIQKAQDPKSVGFDLSAKIIKYCRRCERACPIGKNSHSSDE